MRAEGLRNPIYIIYLFIRRAILSRRWGPSQGRACCERCRATAGRCVPRLHILAKKISTQYFRMICAAIFASISGPSDERIERPLPAPRGSATCTGHQSAGRGKGIIQSYCTQYELDGPTVLKDLDARTTRLCLTALLATDFDGHARGASAEAAPRGTYTHAIRSTWMW